MVRQVLVNLLLNAQQAMPPGAVPAFTVTTGVDGRRRVVPRPRQRAGRPGRQGAPPSFSPS